MIIEKVFYNRGVSKRVENIDFNTLRSKNDTVSRHLSINISITLIVLIDNDR